MRPFACRTKRVFACLSVLLALGASIASADDPNGPVLTDAWLRKGEMDESIGQVVVGYGRRIRAPGLLSLSIEDEARDLLGIRIKEHYLLPSGVESSFEESYPVFAHRVLRDDFFAYSSPCLEAPVVVPVHFRTGNRVKNEQQWQAFLDRVERGEASRETEMPPVYVTMPEPNAVEVFVSVYDKEGHESHMVPVRGLSSVSEERKKRMAADIRRREAKEYDRRATEFARWPQGNVRVQPDNAALLYLRAAACLPDAADPCTTRLTNLMFEGREPDDRVKAYLNKGLNAIHLIQLGSQIPHCDFGLDCGRDVDTGDAYKLIDGLRLLMGTHIRTLKATGHCRAALENCLVDHRMAQHLGDATQWHCTLAQSVDLQAFYGILDVLEDMPTDIETLRWLRQELAATQGAVWQPAVAMRKWRDSELLTWEFYKGDHPFDRSWAIDQIEEEWQRREKMNSVVPDEAGRKKVLELPDDALQVWMLFEQRNLPDCQYGLALSEELLAEACRQYDAFAKSCVEVVNSDASYERKQDRLEVIDERHYEQMESSKPISLFTLCSDVSTFWSASVRDKTLGNLVTVALDIRMIAAETGQVPQSLPEGLPKNLFTDKDFEYELTEDGFNLRMDTQDADRKRTREFEFKILSS